jgi:indolepyruvate ferredoxin oxidoreductase, beta subunit
MIQDTGISDQGSGYMNPLSCIMYPDRGVWMDNFIKQQIVISGVGGQGVLFVTRLLAEAAIMKGYSVFTSETHGMAQRGGTVLSHLKVGHFSSPLIRPGNAGGLLALKTESLVLHGYYMKPDAWAVVNTRKNSIKVSDVPALPVDADTLAQRINNPKSVNLVLLGFALAAVSKEFKDVSFCSFEDIKTVLQHRLAEKKKMLDDAVKALEAGFEEY